MRKKSKKEKNLNLSFVLALIVFTVIFIVVDIRLRPLVIQTARYKVQSIVTKAANIAITEQMSQSNLSYGDLITVSRDENGDIALLSYNALEVNRLKARITASVIEKVTNMQGADIYIPVANLTNIDIIQNKGPRLHFHITPTAYVETDIESSFETTGINQVNHKIYIVLKITASALIPNYSTDVKFETNVCVAQTVIIGKIPENIWNKTDYLK